MRVEEPKECVWCGKKPKMQRAGKMWWIFCSSYWEEDANGRLKKECAWAWSTGTYFKKNAVNRWNEIMDTKGECILKKGELKND